MIGSSISPKGSKALGLPVKTIWSVDFTHQHVRFCDAASTDFTSISALLRRKVEKIIACVSDSCPFYIHKHEQLLNCSHESVWGAYAGLFGRAVYDGLYGGQTCA